MRLFQPENATKDARTCRLHAYYELAYTLVDLTAALLFLAGSIMFFYAELQTPAIWCFLFGSVFFALKPVLRFAREFHLLATGDFDDLARRFE